MNAQLFDMVQMHKPSKPCDGFGFTQSWSSVAEGRACAVVFDCKFIETSASLHHNVHELFEGIVRQIRLRRDSKEINERRRSIYKRKESITKKARRFLDRLAAKNNKKMALKVRSKSCHDLAVLWTHRSLCPSALGFFVFCS